MKRNYFFIVSMILLGLSFFAFSDNLITDVGQKSNSDPKFIIHGLFCFAWFSLLVFQTFYIRKGDYTTHRRLGIIGGWIAAGVFISTVYVFIVIFDSWGEMWFVAKANRFFMASYALLIVLAFVNKANGVKHKRYIYLATIYMLGPILDRVAGKLDWDEIIFNSIVWNLLFISLFFYDWKSLGKVHPISWIGYGWFYLVWVIALFT
ncbi:MAG: hypothetical protein JNM57_08430 [Cyclobacteriaceae bacterium]|nr:hypothetical protein [Cyclobacteriaceae bacterium]